MDVLMNIIGEIGNVLWGPWTFFLLMSAGILFTIWTKFVQYKAVTHGISVVKGDYDDPDDPGAISHFQALSAALSATVGLGNIGGVALAISLGGPGSLFWMWVTSFNAAFDKAFWPWCIFVATLFGGAIWVSREHETDSLKFTGLMDIEFDPNRFSSIIAVAWFALWAMIFVQLFSSFDFGRAYFVVSALAAGALLGAGYLRKQLPQLILIGGLLALVLVSGFQ